MLILLKTKLKKKKNCNGCPASHARGGEGVEIELPPTPPLRVDTQPAAPI